MLPIFSNVAAEAETAGRVSIKSTSKTATLSLPTKKHRGVVIDKVAAHEFGGECQKRHIAYTILLWLVSIWAAITNIAQIAYIKITKRRGDSFGRIMWDTGRDERHVSSSFVDRFSRFNHQAKYGAAGWRSLDLFYNFHEKIAPQLNDDLEGSLTRYWIQQMENRQAVTNRIKLVTKLLTETLRQFSDEPEVRIVSIAAGSAQAVIAAIKNCPQLNVKAKLVDADPSAIAEAQRLANEAGLADHFEFVIGTSTDLEIMCKDFQPHIIEMVGFMDYRPKKQGIRLVNRIKKQLIRGGYFLTCNIKPNREKLFLDWVLLWPMIYRTAEQFTDLLLDGGFAPEKVKVINEPLDIHVLGVCQK